MRRYNALGIVSRHPVDASVARKKERVGITTAAHAGLRAAVPLDLAAARAAHAKWLGGVKPRLVRPRDGVARARVAGVRHPILLEPCLPPLPSPPCAPQFDSDSSSDSDSGYARWEPVQASNAAVPERPEADAPPDLPVALDLLVPSHARVVAVTGPNTGGKTAALKTLGVSVLMAQSGMYIHQQKVPEHSRTEDSNDPEAAPPLELTVFSNVLADLGDSQSLEASLSTFSGHMTQISAILGATDDNALVLLDELGSGTDPKEGSALAIAILRYLSSRAALTAVTTHYSEVKVEADRNPVFATAAVEFDVGTLSPTYKLVWGGQGASNALAVAQRLGFDRSVLASAKKWVQQLASDVQTDAQAESMALEVQKQIEATSREYRAIEAMRLETQEKIKLLEERVAASRAELKQAEQREKRARQSAEAEINRITSLEQQAVSGKVPAADVLKKLELEHSFDASEVNSAQRRLLGIQMGADVTKLQREGDGTEGWAPAVGETVLVVKLGGVEGTVIEAPKRGSKGTPVRLDIDGLEVSVKLADIQQTSGQQQEAKAPKSREGTPKSSRNVELSWGLPVDFHSASQGTQDVLDTSPAIQTRGNTIDLRGKRVDDAMMIVEQELLAKGSKVVFVVHGVGTGAVRREVHQYLKRDSSVQNFELEEASNGGCTVVYLK